MQKFKKFQQIQIFFRKKSEISQRNQEKIQEKLEKIQNKSGRNPKSLGSKQKIREEIQKNSKTFQQEIQIIHKKSVFSPKIQFFLSPKTQHFPKNPKCSGKILNLTEKCWTLPFLPFGRSGHVTNARMQ